MLYLQTIINSKRMKLMVENNKRIQHEIYHGNKISEHAEEVWGWSTAAGQLRADRRAGYFINLGKFNPKQKVLEIGCGTALFTKKVYDITKANIVATDISQSLLDIAVKKIPAVSFRLEDAMKLSFDNNSFNGIYGSSILHHLDIQKSLKEAYRVLKPGGKIVFAEPNMLNPQIFIQKNIPFIKRWLGDSPDETAIVRWSIKKILKEIGFKNVKVFPYDFLHPYTPVFMIGLVKAIGFIVERIPIVKEIAGSIIIYAEK